MDPHPRSRPVRSGVGRVRPPPDRVLSDHAGAGRLPHGPLRVHLHGLGAPSGRARDASGAPLGGRLRDDGCRRHALPRPQRLRLRPRLRRLHLGARPGGRHAPARALRRPPDLGLGGRPARRADDDGGRALARAPLPRALLSLRRHVGSARAVGCARLLRGALQAGLRRAPHLPPVRKVARARVSARRTWRPHGPRTAAR